MRLEALWPRKRPVPYGPDAPKPFADMKKQGDYWVFIRGCSGGECFSGGINDALQPTEEGIWFKYDQTLGDDKKDGWIVIRP